MKIALITTTHSVVDGRIFYKEAKSLSNEHIVTIVAPSSQNRISMYDKIILVEVKRSQKKILQPITSWRIFLASLRLDCDVCHCHEPDSLLIGLVNKLIKKRYLVYDVHEHWPSELPHDLGVSRHKLISSMISSSVNFIEKVCLRYCDNIIAVSDSVGERFQKRKLDIIPNYSIPMLNYDPNDTPARDMTALMYVAGNVRAFHGIRECIFALIPLRKVFPSVSLTLIGNLRDPIDNYLIDEDLKSRVKTSGFVSYQEMYNLLLEGGIGLLLFQPEYYNIFIGLPNKLFDYMIAGLPIIASDLPEIRKVINDAGCGILVDPYSIDEISHAINYLISHPEIATEMGQRGKAAIMDKYNWKISENTLLGMYRTLAV